jgi:threonine synthase
MNVGHPSNLSRLVATYGGVMDETGKILKEPEFISMRNDMYAISIDDTQTRQMIIESWQKYRLLLEPHGSVGWSGLLRYLSDNPDHNNKDQLCISLETAHPAKFPEQIRELLHFDPDLPPSLKGIESKQESYVSLSNNYDDFKAFLVRNYS